MPPEFPVDILPDGEGYRITRKLEYYSTRYQKYVTVEEGFISDGASGPAEDIVSLGWIFHDKLCVTGCFDDGSKCTNFMASMILRDILLEEGRYVRANTWFFFTWLGRPVLRFLGF